ncbi:hypothetical protein [Halocola ammonii]
MRKLFIGLMSAFISISLTAQDLTEKAEIQWSEEVKNSRKQEVEQTIVANSDFFIVKAGRDITVEKFDGNMNLAGTIEVSGKFAEGEAEFVKLLVVGDELFVFLKDDSEIEKSDKLAFLKIDIKSFRVTASPKVFWSTKERLPDKYYRGSFEVLFSEDESKIAILNNKYGMQVDYKLFDLEMNLQHEKEIVLELEDYDIEPIMKWTSFYNPIHFVPRATGSGDLFIQLISENKKEPGLESRSLGEKPKMDRLLLYKYSISEGTEKYLNLDLENRRVLISDYAFASSDNLLVGGIFSNNITSDEDVTTDGAFVFSVDPNSMRITGSSADEFASGVIAKSMVRKGLLGAESRYRPEIEMELRGLNASTNGFQFVAEQYFDSESDTKYFMKTMDIITVSASSEGEIQWISMVDKKQELESRSPDFHEAYTYPVFKNGQIHLFYNVAGEFFYSEEEQKGMGRSTLKTNFTAWTIVDESGNVSSELLSNNDETGQLLVPGFSEASRDGGHLFMYTLDGNKQKVGKVTFK